MPAPSPTSLRRSLRIQGRLLAPLERRIERVAVPDNGSSAAVPIVGLVTSPVAAAPSIVPGSVTSSTDVLSPTPITDLKCVKLTQTVDSDTTSVSVIARHTPMKEAAIAAAQGLLPSSFAAEIWICVFQQMAVKYRQTSLMALQRTCKSWRQSVQLQRFLYREPVVNFPEGVDSFARSLRLNDELGLFVVRLTFLNRALTASWDYSESDLRSTTVTMTSVLHLVRNVQHLILWRSRVTLPTRLLPEHVLFAHLHTLEINGPSNWEGNEPFQEATRHPSAPPLMMPDVLQHNFPNLTRVVLRGTLDPRAYDNYSH
ncbi:hypothetical protein A4X13_0g3980 [Tilletia indica]|uniref:F-box domain-containing protein n=1 Tax=Tilletia indica TaxID=43049 RepID=A0A8T8SZS8_9BASI|nr:hypothetical protein A4X13_0g3980 [Tilletia indica]